MFIKATSSNGKISYNSITVNAITEFIKLCIAVYIAHNEGSLHTLKQAISDPGLMVRFAIPNLMYAVNNNLFHYSVGALPPAVFVVTINAFRTLITAVLQPCVSNQALTGRQVVACILLMLSFVFASLPEVIKVVFSGAMQGSILESLLYLSSIYSIISVTASLSQEKLLKDSKSLMVANIINYSIGITFQVSGMIYEKYTSPETDLFRGLDVFWVRAIPCLMAIMGLSISFVLKYYDNIVKLLCSSISVLLVNSITAAMVGDTIFNAYFLAGWLLTFPATYLYYVAPQPLVESASVASVLVKPSQDSSGSFLDEEAEEMQSLLEPKDDIEKSSNKLEIISSVEGNPVQSWLESLPRERMILGGIVTALVIFSTLTSTFEIEVVETKMSTIPTSMQLLYKGIDEVEKTCSLFEVPYSDSRSNLHVVDVYSAKYGKQYSTVDYVSGDIFVSCSKDLFITGPESNEFHLLQNSEKKSSIADDSQWSKIPASVLEEVENWGSIRSLFSLQRDTDFSDKTTTLPYASSNASSNDVDSHSQKLLSAEKFKRLPWSHIDKSVGEHAQYFWLWCSDHSDANLVTRPPVLQKTPEPPRASLSESMKKEVNDFIQTLSVPTGKKSTQSQEKIHPHYDTVLVLYIDAISRLKFEKFFHRSSRLLNSLAPLATSVNDGDEYAHSAIELKRLHAVGINSEKNYPQFLSGVSAYDTKRYYHKKAEELEIIRNKTSNVTPTEAWLQSLMKTTSTNDMIRREPWIFDIAEVAGFSTVAGVTNCPSRCSSNCYEKAKTSNFYEQGGFHTQYLSETEQRLPGMWNYPTASYCEPAYRSSISAHACSTCDSPHIHSKIPELSKSTWIANKLGMSYVLDWWRVWLASTASVKSRQPRFGVIVIEETHQQDFLEQIDMEIANFIHDLTHSSSNRQLFGTERMAMVIMADHGLHFMAEFKVPTGKIANKQPFGYFLIPRAIDDNQRVHQQLLTRNAHALTTSYDIRATLLSWMTGREWSADVVQAHSERPVHQQRRRLSERKSYPDEAAHIRSSVFATQHGLNLATSSVPFNRTCTQAGIPSDFCGCNLQPCNGNIKQLVHNSAKSVVSYINRRIADASPQSLSICKPLHDSEIIFLPGLDDCLSSSSTTVVNAYVQRNLRLLSITYVFDNDKVDSGSSWHHPNTNLKLKVSNVNTISNYGNTWHQCVKKFDEKNMTHTIPDDSFQFCYCVNDHSWASTAAGIINSLNF